MLKDICLHAGEFNYKEYHPIGNFVSGILDVTIIKPFIESIYGYDLITGEKLTDFERGMQLVNAVVGAVTFGQGALALNFAEMSGKEAVTALVKISGESGDRVCGIGEGGEVCIPERERQYREGAGCGWDVGICGRRGKEGW